MHGHLNVKFAIKYVEVLMPESNKSIKLSLEFLSLLYQ